MKTLKEISARLKIAKSKIHSLDTKNQKLNSSNLGNAFKISTEFVAAVVVGSTIGFILDSLFDTKPWLIIFFFIIGVVAGIRSIVKTAKMMQEK